MGATLQVYAGGLWYDQDHGYQMTLAETPYLWVSIAIGIAIGGAQPFAQQIVFHLIAWTRYLWQRSSRRNTDHGDAAPDVAAHPSESTRLIHQERGQSRSCGPKVCSCGGVRAQRMVSWLVSGALTVLIIAHNIAGAFVATIPTDRAVLSGSTHCGLWGLKDDANPGAQDLDTLILGEKERRAGQYARSCYSPRFSASVDQCMLFKQSHIPTLRLELGQPCPFVNETYCPGAGLDAVKITTGLVDAKRIGINTPHAPKFNRTTVCVPINMNPGFAKNTSSRPGHWAHDFGPVESEEHSSDYTFFQFGDPFRFDVRSYTMSTYRHVYSKARSQNYWQPIQSLDVRQELNAKSEAYSITIMFINSCRIFYKEDSNDRIFQADEPWYLDPELWYNHDSRARPLVCIDWIEVCKHDGRSCSPPYQEAIDEDKGYIFTRYALNKSTVFDAVEFQGASALDAQSKIIGDTSLPLSKSPPQWVKESWNLFNASLARVQYDALDIANGTDRDRENLYVPKMPAWVQSQMCHLFTFQAPKGYNNLGVWPTLGILVLLCTIVLLGWETNNALDEKIKDTGFFGEGRMIGLEWLLIRALKLLYRPQQQAEVSGEPAHVPADGANAEAHPEAISQEAGPSSDTTLQGGRLSSDTRAGSSNEGQAQQEASIAAPLSYGTILADDSTRYSIGSDTDS